MKPSKRGLLVMSSSAALLTAAVLFPFLLAQEPNGLISRPSYNRVQVGMSAAEVEAILGKPGPELVPAGWEDVAYDESAERTMKRGPGGLRHWLLGDRRITVQLDVEGKVVNKYYTRKPGAAWLRRLADWLGF